MSSLSKQKHSEHSTLGTGIIENILNNFSEKEVIVVNDGYQICTQGNESDYLYQILDGVVAIKAKDANGINKFIDFAGQGEFIGLSNVVLSTSCNFDIYAFGKVKLLRVDQNMFKNHLDNDPSFAANVLILLTKETASKEGRLFNLLNLNVYHRVGYLIIRLAQLFGYDREHKIPVMLKVETLCQLTGSTVSTIYNALNKLRLNDCAYFENGSIHIISLGNLKYQFDGQEQVLLY